MTKVGDLLYQLHNWRRAGQPKWEPAPITGETKVSWLLGDIKVNKKTMVTAKDYRGHNERYCSYEEMVAQDFCDLHARDLASHVSVCKDPEKLKRIAAIVGMELKNAG